MSHVQQMATLRKVPPDWGYVYNFQDPSQPEPISLPCGHMRVLAADMNELVDTVQRDVPKVFESNDYTERMEAALQHLQERRQDMTDALERSAIEAGFTLRSTPAGITPVPVKDGRPLSEAVSTIDEGIEALTGLPAGERQDEGRYPGGTVHERVERRLREMAQTARNFAQIDQGETVADEQ